MCPDCSQAIVSLSSRCTKCRSEIPVSCYVSIPKNRYLPKLQLNHVVQVSLGATDAVLSSGLPEKKIPVPESKRAEKEISAPEEQFEVEKIIDKRRTSRNKPEYLVVFKDHPGEDEWLGMANLRGCREAIDAFERNYFPSACAKTGSECCKCGDTGCEGPVISATGLSSSSGRITTPVAIVVSSSSGGCITTPAVVVHVSSSSSSSSGTAASALIV